MSMMLSCCCLRSVDLFGAGNFDSFDSIRARVV